MRSYLWMGVLVLGIGCWIVGLSFRGAEGEMNLGEEKDTISLPEPKLKGAVSLEEAIQKRRSKRSYADEELTMEEISQLLWSVQGITDERMGFRAAPSAGALYPLEVYLVSSAGFYRYLPDGHRLRRLSEEDLRRPLAHAALGQGFIAEAPIDIVICAVYRRVTSKYGERGIRYTHIEVGHAAQNLHLEAVALGLGSVPIGAFSDEGVKKVLNLPKDHEPIYIIPVGHTE